MIELQKFGRGVRSLSIVRQNLLTCKGYTPCCGGEYSRCGLPRTVFDGEQFKCPKCNFKTAFEPEFIEQYKTAQATLKE